MLIITPAGDSASISASRPIKLIIGLLIGLEAKNFFASPSESGGRQAPRSYRVWVLGRKVLGAKIDSGLPRGPESSLCDAR
jgi:hypothetical protein